MGKRFIFWFRACLLIAIIFGTIFWCSMAFLTVHNTILSYPDDLAHPLLWGTVAVLCVLLLPLVFVELFALSLTKNSLRKVVLYKVLEVTCWIGAGAAVVVPAVFSVTQDVGHITIILFQMTTAAVCAVGALLARMCHQLGDKALFLAESGGETPEPGTAALAAENAQV